MLSKEVIHVYGLIRSRLFYFSTSALESLLSKGMLGTPVIEVRLKVRTESCATSHSFLIGQAGKRELQYDKLFWFLDWYAQFNARSILCQPRKTLNEATSQRPSGFCH